MLGLQSVDQILGRKLCSFFEERLASGNSSSLQEELGHSLHQGKRGHGRTRIQTKNKGKQLVIDYWCHPIRESGEVVGVVVTAVDVSEREYAELALRKSEARYRLLVESAPEAIILFDLTDDTMVDANIKAANLYACSMDVLLQKKPSELLRNLMGASRSWSKLLGEHQLPNSEPILAECELAQFSGAGFPAEVQLVTFDGHFCRASIMDISVRRSQQKERDALIDQLEQKNKELEGFTYTVSHDLKRPLVTINGFLGVVEESIESGRAHAIPDAIGTIRRAANRMTTLLEDLLEFSRIGRKSSHRIEVDTEDLVREVWELFRAPEVNAKVHLKLKGDFPTVWADRAGLSQVFQNLIDNAIKFSKPSESIQVEVGYTGIENDAHCFYVKDHGIGVKEKYAQKVFTLFEQLDPHAAGTGIGLSICKRIIELHGGRIWIEANSSDSGSTFYLTLLSMAPDHPLN